MRYAAMGSLVIVLVLGMGACTVLDSGDTGPTATPLDLTVFPTAIFLTENAPPAGFSEVSFNPIDARLASWPGWAYTITGSFDGTFDDNGEDAQGTFTAVIQANELGEWRWIVLDVAGEALLPGQSVTTIRLEGVRKAADYYFVDANRTCSENGGESQRQVVDLGAAELIGGVVQAAPTGHRETINGIQTWNYTFAPSDVRLPSLAAGRDPGRYSMSGEATLQVAPAFNAVMLYEAIITVEQGHVLWADRTVSGRLFLRYDLNGVFNSDALPNISIPNGCPVS